MRRRLVLVIIVFSLIYLGIQYTVPVDFFGEGEAKLIEIRAGESLTSVAETLNAQGVVRSVRAFLLKAKSAGAEGLVQPGRYQLATTMSMGEIIAEITSTEKSTVSVTIPEGFSSFDIDERLVSMGLIKAGEFSDKAQKYEGRLFPDTYFVYSTNFTPESLIEKMTSTFDQKFTAEMKASLAQSGRTMEEVVTMASILEKEVRSDKDRALVAGILWKRLDSDWAIQADATSLYGKKIRTITARDLDANETPYSTRNKLGLPPGPISNPGLNSLTATLSPESSDDWFYLSGPDGTTHYAKTNDEHNENRRLYLP
ncbi:endolytic transglycosylase MltG [Candidatus Peregrinibacteria bacterium CG_4_9_14_0_2_um_filter_53_11]|nr:MAG: endolytic transglycosylase MltG [Candidatus Peregrinibacteria bacterium CG_4_9_14_0_2_um_filter_53_11]